MYKIPPHLGLFLIIPHMIPPLSYLVPIQWGNNPAFLMKKIIEMINNITGYNQID